MRTMFYVSFCMLDSVLHVESNKLTSQDLRYFASKISVSTRDKIWSNIKTGLKKKTLEILLIYFLSDTFH